MDENLKDVLLVCLGSFASLLGSVIALLLQGRRDKAIAKLEQRQKHYEEVQNFLYANAAMYAGVVDFLASVNSGMNVSLQSFETRINPMLGRIADSRFNGLPNIAITRDKKIIDKLTEIQDYLLDAKIIVNLISSGNVKMTTDQVQKEVQKLAEMNELIADVLAELEKRVY